MMNGLVRRVLAGGVLALCVATALPAWGAGRVLRPSGSTLAVEQVRLARSYGPAWSTLWISLTVGSGQGNYALVLPVPPGTAVDPALDAWFDALESATAPRTRPPLGAPACGATTSSSIDNTAQTPSLPTSSPLAVAVIDGVAELPGLAGTWGLTVDAADVAALEPFASSAFVVVVYAAGAPARTETLRLSLPDPESALEVGLLRDDLAPPELDLFTVVEGRARITELQELEPDQVAATWKVFEGDSDYIDRRRDLLGSTQGAAWLTESSGHSLLFDWTPLAGGAGAVEPVSKRYLDLAKAQGVLDQPIEPCRQQILDAAEQGTAGARVGRACGLGSLAKVPGGTDCSEVPGVGEISAAALRCGAADDFAYLLSGQYANASRVTRQLSVAGPLTPSRVVSTWFPGAELPLLVTCQDLDTTGCPGGPSGAGGWGNAGGGGGYGGGYGGGSAGYGAEEGYYDPGMEEPQPQVEVNCWGSTESSNGASDDSCGGDSSDSSSDGDSCGGDSSDPADPDGDTCGGDSTDGSDPGGDACGGDSSSDGGDTCSGDGSSSSSGDSCGGGSSSGGSGDCSAARLARPRLRVSALTLALAAVLLPLRRLARRRKRR